MPRTPEEVLKTQIERDAAEQGERLQRAGIQFPITLDFITLSAVAGHLHLALRHPQNRGPARFIARKLLEGIRMQLCSQGAPAVAKMFELGEDPAFDEAPRTIAPETTWNQTKAKLS